MPDQTESLPSYATLFGAFEKAEGQRARSVLSPAAYLVDLLQLQDGVIGGTTAGDARAYHARRPDVGAIPLDETRTFGEVPHLEISNAVMTRLAEDGAAGSVDAKLAGAIFPAPLPFSLDHARLGRCLGKLGTDASEVYRLYAKAVDGHEVARLRLGLSEAEHALFVTRRDTEAEIAELWGIRDAQEKAKILDGDLAVIRQKLGLSTKELKALLYQDLDDGEIARGVAAGFFINRPAGPPPATPSYLTLDPAGKVRQLDGSPWTLRHLDRTMRFVRLARRLGLEFAELDWILQSTGAADLDADALQAIAVALDLKARHALAIDELCCLWAAPKAHGHGDGAEPADLFDRIFNRGYPTAIETLFGSAWPEALTGRLVAALRISRADHDLLVAALAARGAPASASRAYVALLHRMAALAELLALGVRDLFVLIDVVDAQWTTADHDALAVPMPYPPAGAPPARPVFAALVRDDASIGATLTAVQKLLRVRAWLEEHELSVRQLGYVCLPRLDDGAPIDGVVPDDAIEAALDELYQTMRGRPVLPADLQRILSAALGVADDLVDVLIQAAFGAAGGDAAQALAAVTAPLAEARAGGERALAHPALAAGFRWLRQLALVLGKAGFTADEARGYVGGLGGLGDRRALELGALPDLWDFKALADAHASPPCTLLQYLAGADQGADHGADRLAAMTGWPAAEITRLVADGALPGGGLADARTLAALARAFAFADRLGTTPSALRTQLWDRLFGAAPRDLAAAADSAYGLVKARTRSAEWPAVARALGDPLLPLRRDALVAHLVHTRGLANADDLYEHLLHDVRMGETATTSPIIEAVGSVQLYYQRALMDLERAPDVVRAELAAWWPWMKNYRVWEANRRAFLYPEDYIRPELRTVKSPEFEQLEQSLLQGDITDATVRKAYATYLKQFARVSRLRIAGGYVYLDEHDERHVLVFGFERTEPLTYYRRRGRLPAQSGAPIAWTPWRKLGITVNVERVQPVFAFGRMFLFWIEPRFTNETEFSGGGSYGGGDEEQTARPVIKYSFEDASEEWLPPQTLRATVHQKADKRGKERTSWTVGEVDAARLYLSNPSPKRARDPDEYVYVLLSIRNISDRLVGRLSAALDFEPLSAIPPASAAAFGKIDTGASFPIHLGIARTGSTRWGVDFGGVLTSPWFSFDAGGGSFLCRPIEPAPDLRGAANPTIVIRGRTFPAGAIDGGFGTPAGDLFVFTTEAGKACYHQHSGGAWTGPLPTATTWGNARGYFDQRPDEQIENVVVVGATTYVMTESSYFTYSAADYGTVEQPAAIDQQTMSDVVAGRPDLKVLTSQGRHLKRFRLALDPSRTLSRAFKHGDSIVIVTKLKGKYEYVIGGLDQVRAHAKGIAAADPPTPESKSAALAVKSLATWERIDTASIQLVGDKRYMVLTFEREVVKFGWSSQTWSASNLDASHVPAGVGALAVAFRGADGKTYFISDDDEYAEIAGNVTPVFRSVADRWGRFPSRFARALTAVDAALAAPDGRAYLFSGRQCLSYSDLTATALASPVMDGDASRPIDEVWDTELDQVTAAFCARDPDGPGWKSFLFGVRHQEVKVPGSVAKVPVVCYERYSRLEDGGFQRDDGYPKVLDGKWGNVPETFKVGFDAAVQVASTGDAPGDLYLVRGGTLADYFSAAPRPYEMDRLRYSIIRLTSNTAAGFSQHLLASGVAGLLSLASQQTAEVPRFSADSAAAGQDVIACTGAAFLTDYPGMVATDQRALDFDSANGFYYWEIFFHIPYLIAQTLNQAQRFEEARTWYEYVFDPTENRATDGRAFWKFLPFHDATDGGGRRYLEDPDQLAKYRDDPFDPHGLAQLRPIAYRKAFVMSYIDNLLDWGDLLFQQFTRESLGEATMLYVLAADLLGKPPEETGERRLPFGTTTYDQLRGASTVAPDLLALENTLPPATGSLRPARAGTPNDSILNPYFFFPENEEFIAYWDRVADRLHKLRGGLDFDGVRRSLALLSPPVDVMAAVAAFAGGGGAAQLLADGSVAVPHYRFAFMLAKARELTGRLFQLGGALLSALEKQDAERLSLLRNTQERGILEATLAIKEDQRDNAKQSLAGLKVSLASAKTREGHYRKLLDEGLSGYEQMQVTAMTAANIAAATAGVLHNAAGGMSLIANIGSLFAFTYGGKELSGAADGTGKGMKAQSDQFAFLASLFSLLGGWDRRTQDWKLQRTLAGHDIEQLGHQIKAAETQVAIAQKEIAVQRRQIKNNLSVDTFMKSKFTNQQLYRWMVGKLSAAYFQTYQLALDYAKGAQRALQFEMGWPESDVQYIGAYYWDSLHKGLLAGERLQLDLDRMEQAHVEKNRRRFEITKTISLMRLDPLALLDLRRTGTCELELTEALYDHDFPGHYCRQIKTVSVSFPAIVGPHENFNATLSQLGHRTVLRPDLAAVKYLLTAEGDVPAAIRTDWRPTQQVALSRGLNDSGLFQLNYQDERYLPFEGTGAVSRWRLEINGVDSAAHREHLRDVVFTVQYTALPGGDDLTAKVKGALPAVERARMLQLAYDFPDEWQAFLRDPARGLALTIGKAQLPGADQSTLTGLYLHYDLTESGAGAIGRQAMRLTCGDETTELTPGSLRPGPLPLGSWSLAPTARAERFTAEHVKDIALVVVYAARPAF